jgi:hypothetical protein
MNITFINQVETDFDCPRLTQFINRTPTLRALDEAHVQFDIHTARVKLRYRTSELGFDNLVILLISCRGPDRQLSSIEQVYNSSLHPLSIVEDLYIERHYSGVVLRNDRRREHPTMVATLTSIYHGEESLPIQGLCARYRGRPARARWGQNNRSVAQPAEYFR